MASNTRELILKLTLDEKDFTVKSAQIEKEINNIADQTEKANEKIKKANESLIKYSAAVSGALTAAGIACTNMAVKFNESFSQVQTLIPESAARITELQDAVLELSPAVGKSTSDLAAGLYEIISAFGDSADSAKSLEIAAKAATAGGATTQQSIALLSAVTKGYGDTTAAAQQKVSDLAFMTIKLGQTTMPELASSIQRVTAMSNTLGVSQEELFAVFSASTGVIGGAAEVSTQLAAVYNELMKPGAELTKTFERLGVASGTELIEKFGSLQGALNEIKRVADETGKPVNTLFGSVEAGRLALYATGSGAEKFATDLQKMQEAVGATDTAFTAATTGGVNSFGFQLEQLKLHFNALTIKIGQELIPTFQSLLTPVLKGVEWLSKLDKTSISIITTIGTMAVTFTGVIAGIGLATKAFAAFNTILAANPIGAVVAGVSALVVALSALSKKIDEAKYKLLEDTKAQDEKTQTYIAQGNALKGLIKERANLLAIEKRSADDEKRLAETEKQITEALKKYRMYSGGGGKSFGGELTEPLELDIELNLSNEEILDKIKEKSLSINRNIADIENEIKKLEKEKESFYLTTYDGFTGVSNTTSDEKAIAKYNEGIATLRERIVELKDLQANLDSISLDDFIADVVEVEPEIKIDIVPTYNEQALAQVEAVREKTQSERLKDLDDAYTYEVTLIQNLRGTEEEKAAALKQLDKNHYDERLELLKEFLRERLAEEKTFDEAMQTELENQLSTIESEIESTYNHISKLQEDDTEQAKTLAEILKEVADEVEKVGTAIKATSNAVTGIGLDVLNYKQEQEAKKLADRLAEIEREKNETLMAMEDEYLTWKEERELEAREREEQAAQEQYEKRIAELATNLNETENAFAQETNIEKARNKEKELEAARRAKAEEEQKRKEQEAEKKRQAEERKAEIEMLNARNQAQWEFQVATIEAQNASGEATAKLAHQQAAFEKAQSITSLIVQSAIETARAAASFAQMDFIGGALHTSAAAVAIAQSGIIGATPLPSATFNPAPLPQAPRAIKFATGGIVYPSSGGTNFTLPNGTPGIAGEAGLPEIILPINQENMDAVFRSRGITNTQSVNLAPTYNLTIMTDGTEQTADTVMNVLREHDRELLALVESTRRMNYIE